MKSIPGAIGGGFESLPGDVIGGVVIGASESLSRSYIDPLIWGFNDVVAYVVLLIILMVRPYGLFGQKRIERI